MNFRLSVFSAPVSIACGILIFFLFGFFTPFRSGARETATSGGSYAVLAFDESTDDRAIQKTLAQNGMGNFVSESSQYVPIDDFGTLKMLPLDSFHDEIEAFDPRDDGYAAKLKSFFVHGGKRFFFCPLEDTAADKAAFTGTAAGKPAGNSGAYMKQKLESVFGGIPFSFAVLGRRQSFFLYFALLALGSAFTLYLARARRRFLFQLPLLLALGGGGPSALIPAALLSGIWELLREPLGELFAGRRYEGRGFNYAGTGVRGALERLKPFRQNLFLTLLCVVFLTGFSVAGNFPPVPLAAACACFTFLYFFSLYAENDRTGKNRHIPFVPVLLFPIKSKTFSLFPFLAPFAALSVLALFFPQIYTVPEEHAAFADSRYFVSPAEYYRHVAFERSFSYSPLGQSPHQAAYAGEGQPPPLNQEAYLRYYLGDDGLIAGSFRDGLSTGPFSGEETSREPMPEPAGGQAAAVPAALAGQVPKSPAEPLFPLEKLMEFLVDYNERAGRGSLYAAAVKPVDWIIVGIILAVCIMDFTGLFSRGIFFRRLGVSHKKKAPVFGSKRIAA